ncbi:hypothetical protein MXB_1984 [Myxobolus squamalis]|nr:hypothetical protein MXB_1984 [Myxobolus squamalis]
MDVYSLSLVIWELFNRAEIVGIVLDFSLPYANCAGIDPSIDNMNSIVNDMNHRPTLRSSPSSYNVLQIFYIKLFSDINRLIRKCWKKIPSQRPDMEDIMQYSEFLYQKYSQQK